MRHLRSIMHSGTRTLEDLARLRGEPYLTSGHIGVDPLWDQMAICGYPVDVPVRPIKDWAISTAHHAILGRMRLWNHVFALRDLPNVNLIDMREIDHVKPESQTPDVLGLREAFDGRPLPEYFLKGLGGPARDWLRSEFGDDV